MKRVLLNSKTYLKTSTQKDKEIENIKGTLKHERRNKKV